MNTQMLLAVWGLLAVYVSSAVVEPVQVAELATLKATKEPVQLIKFFEDINLDDGSTGPVTKSNVELFRYTITKRAIANTVQVVTVRYTGRAATRISSYNCNAILCSQLNNLGQSARVTAGGTNRNTVTVEIRSARGGRINTQFVIRGHF